MPKHNYKSVKEIIVPVNDTHLFVKLYESYVNKPIIIMEAGYGDDLTTWDSIVKELSEEATVLVYDRAGVGKSEKSGHPRTSLQMVEELNSLLNYLDIELPYILVGHSFGGVNARLFASTYPHKVGGLVLIDSTPEEYKERFLSTMSTEFQFAYDKQFTIEGNYDEFMESLQQLKDRVEGKSNIPLKVISAGKKAHYSKESQLLWNQMQQEIVSRFTNAEWIMAKTSAHYVHHDEPAIVIAAIKKMIHELTPIN
ncbi:alpha/beta fold hydrolase [Alkalihalobacillus sp. 1P02AB]|uniref:alpha/beta fold hydrolase n=1 Tax=Alkalihalobacillus sp. 1P02AB TaxID=3132260 RepID=UPI0039A56BD5